MTFLAFGEIPIRIPVADIFRMIAGALGVVEVHVQDRGNRLESKRSGGMKLTATVRFMKTCFRKWSRGFTRRSQQRSHAGRSWRCDCNNSFACLLLDQLGMILPGTGCASRPVCASAFA